MKYKKAQISGLDLILALMLFFTVVTLFAVLWDTVHYNVKSSADADIIAIQVANRLLESPGYPQDWNATNVELIGLSSERGVVDQSKLENLFELITLDYDKVRELLGLGPYQIYINMTYTDGTPVYINGQPAQGGIPPADATSVSSIRRTALYGEIVVHNNSITFIFDSSGSMDWYSTSLGYKSTNLTPRNLWVNIYNVTFPSSGGSNFDFVLEFNNTGYTGGSDVLLRVTSPSGVNYTSPNCGSSSGCSCGTGCRSFSYAGAVRMNFTQSRWDSSLVGWKVWVRKTVNPAIWLDLMVQTPARRVDAAKTATKAFVDVISNESKGIDEMSLFDFNSCSSEMINSFITDYAQIKSNVDTITASGSTPLAQAIKDTADYTNSSANRKHRMIIVVSDGSETCGGNVVSAADYAVNTKKVDKICTVGFAQGSTGENQLKQAAAIGNCQYYSAKNEQELELALRDIYFGQIEKQKVVLNIVVWR